MFAFAFPFAGLTVTGELVAPEVLAAGLLLAGADAVGDAAGAAGAWDGCCAGPP